jgi:hypothetical protein
LLHNIKNMKDNTVGVLLGLFYIAVWIFIVVGVLLTYTNAMITG